MIRPLAAAALLMLAACHRQGAADVTLDADADARNATAAKTLADLAAADGAARAPLPAAASVPRPHPGADAAPGHEAGDDAPDTNDDDAAADVDAR